MFMQMLNEYEIEKVEPRDLRNRQELGEIKSLLQQFKGMLKFPAVLCSIVSIIWICLEISSHARK